jgi:3-hydroxyisobutyrate dehydrogenase-like beta-hydroxyacid dehydrogenase
MKKILFIGAGKMGLPMAGHIARLGDRWDLQVHDVQVSQKPLAQAQGLVWCEEPVSRIQEADLIISSLPNDEALWSVAQSLREHAQVGSLYVDTSTVSVGASAQVAQALQAQGVHYLRVSVSGNNHMAQAAQLTLMASGPKEHYEACQEIFAAWGPQQFYLGLAEEARLMKLVVNLLIVQTSAMLAEGLALGQQGGLEWSSMWEVLCSSAVGSPILRAKSKQLGRPLGDRDFEPTFTVHQMLKDLDLMLQAGKEFNVPLQQTAITAQWMQSALAHGEGEKDYAVVIKVLERMSGLEPRD